MKTFAIVTTQVLLGLFVVALGATMLTMPVDPAQRLVPAGLADTLRFGIGGAQVIAGLCLMVPRAHIVAAAMLATMTAAVAAAGMLPSTGDSATGAARAAPQSQAAVAGTCGRTAPPARSTPIDWRI